MAVEEHPPDLLIRYCDRGGRYASFVFNECYRRF